MTPRTKILISCSAAAGIFAFGAAAQADDLTADQSARARAKAECAAFGPGFTAVEGDNGCVWIGRHLRVRFGARAGGSSDNGPAPAAAPVRVNAGDRASEDADIAPSHLRLRDGDETGSIAR